MAQQTNYRWRIVLLLFFATTINYIDRQVIGILKPYISDDLGWSEADYGYIVTAFQVAYAIGLLIAGKFLDKFGTRLGYLSAVGVWSIACLLHAFSRSVFSFSAVRFGLGLGESANFPAAIKTVAEWFPKKERAFATGLFNSGSTIGAIFAPLIVSAITLAMGWQWTFLVTGSLGFIWIFFWVKYYTIPQKHPKVSANELLHITADDAEACQQTIPWIRLLMFRQTWAIVSTRFISDWVWWFFLFWTPDYLNKIHHINIKEVVLPLVVIYSVSSIGGVGGGWLSSHFIKQGRSIDMARKQTILLCAVMVLPIAMVPHIQSLWVSVILIALAAAGHQGWASNIFTVVSDIYPKNAVATMTGITGFAGAIGGALSAFFVGLVLDCSNAYWPIFAVASSVYLINWLILRILIPNIKPLNLQ